MNPTQWGLVQSIFTIGGLVGALIAGPVSSKYGRLLAMRLLTAALFLGPVGEAGAPSMFVMSAGRFISGIGAGAATVVCPIYISEISPADKKGLFGAFTQVMINVGILLAQSLGYFLSRDNLWRIILAVASVIAIIEFCGLLVAPESPEWLAKHHQTAIARRVLQKIRGPETDIDDETKEWDTHAEEEEEESLLAPRVAPTKQNLDHVSFFDVVRLHKYRKAVIAVVAVMVTQQLCGINSVVMYSVSILGTILPTAAVLVTVLVSAINVVVTLLCAPLADKIGRKVCLLLSIAGMGVSSVLLAFALSYDIPALSVVATLTFVGSFGVGLGPVPFILASELVGPEAVGATQSWALAGNWIATFCVAQFFPIINHALPTGQVYWIFAAVALVMGSFILWWVPESKGCASADEVWAKQEGGDARRVD
jgi:sugar porter (SP) family MFS transporter